MLFWIEQEFFFAGARTIHVDRRPNALIDEFTVEVKFHVARALKLLENDIVHARAGIDEGRGENGKASSLFEVSGRPEKALRLVQRVRIDTAGENLTRRGYFSVVGSGKTGDLIQQDHHVGAIFDESLRFLDHHFADLDVPAGRLVESGTDDFSPRTLDAALHLG